MLKIKNQILTELKSRLQAKIEEATYEIKKQEDYVQEGDHKSDGKYDTRLTEANYLLDGKKKRLQDLLEEAELLSKTMIDQAQEEVVVGSLVEVTLNEKKQNIFMAAAMGGELIALEGKAYLVLTPFSPLGEALMGSGVEDEVEIETPKQMRYYKIDQIY